MTDEQNHHVEALIKTIFDTHADGVIDCESCDAHLCRLAELVSSGADICTLIPEVEAHLKCCRDCKEEWDALIAIMCAEQAGLLKDSE